MSLKKAILDQTPLRKLVKIIENPERSLGDILSIPGPKALVVGTLETIATMGVGQLLNAIWSPVSASAPFRSLALFPPHAHVINPLQIIPITVGVLCGSGTSVLVHRFPSGRIGDYGFLSCPLHPFFTVTAGSSKVFIAGRQAARLGDFVAHCAVTPSKPPAIGSGNPLAKLASRVDPRIKLAKLSSGLGVPLTPKEVSSKVLEPLDFIRSQIATGVKGLETRRGLPKRAAELKGSTDAANPTHDLILELETHGSENDVATALAESGLEFAGNVAVGKAVLDIAYETTKRAIETAAKAAPVVAPCISGLLSPFLSVKMGGLPLPKITPTALLKNAVPALPASTTGLKSRRSGWTRSLWRGRNNRKRAKARVAEAHAASQRMLVGDPVDAITGAVIAHGTDAHLQGSGWTLPIHRRYSSAWAARSGPLGCGWSLSLDLAIWIEGDQLIHRTPDGRELMIDLPNDLDLERRPQDLALLTLHDPRNALRITGAPGGRWRITVADGDDYSADGIREVELAPIAGDPAATDHPFIARATQIRGPEGATLDLHYDGAARLITARLGTRELGLRWAPLRKADSPSDTPPPERIVALTLADPEGPGEVIHTRYEYSEAGDLVAVVDTLGHRSGLAYDPDHRLIRNTLADGLAFTFEYEGRGAEGRCVRTTGPGGVFHRRLSYNDRRRQTVIYNGVGEVTVVDADNRGRVAAITDTLGATWSFEYDAHDHRIAERDPLDNLIRFAYDRLGRLRQVVRGDGATFTFDHDLDGRRILAVDGAGGRWRWRWDDGGRLVEAVDPCGRASTCEHRESHRVTALWGPSLDAFAIDGDGAQSARPAQSVEPEVSALSAQSLHPTPRSFLAHTPHRANSAHSTTITAPSEALLSSREADLILEHNLPGDLLRAVQGDGATWTYRYDRRGRQIAATDPTGKTYSLCYDLRDQLIAISCDLEEVWIDRDPRGRPRQLLRRPTDGEPTDIRLTYDPCGRIASVQGDPRYPDGITYQYDLEGRLLEVHAGERAHRLERDPCGAVVTETDADGRRRRFLRDPCGRILERIDANGESTAYSYDPCGRILTIDYADGARETFAYRGDGALRSALREEPGDRPPSGALPGPRRRHLVEFERDAYGRVIGERQSGDFGIDGRWIACDRDPRGRLRHLRSDRALSVDLTYASPTAWLPAAFTIADRDRRWTFDLAPATRSFGDLVATDDTPNTPNAPNTPNNPNNPDIAASVGAPAHPVPPQRRDRAGRATALLGRDRDTPSGEPSLGWDAAGRLRSYEVPDGARLTFDYDALGRRIRKRCGERETIWVWEGDRPFIEEVSEVDPEGSLRPVNRHFWLFEPTVNREGEMEFSFRPLAAILSGELLRIVSAPSGLPLATRDAGGVLLWRRNPQRPQQVQAELGAREERDDNGYNGSKEPTRSPLPFGYAGHYHDPETGLAYSRHRYFDPDRGCFLSPDPSGLHGGLEPFAYVADPDLMIDPFGLRGDSAQNPPLPAEQTPGAASAGPLSPEPEPPREGLVGQPSIDRIEGRRAFLARIFSRSILPPGAPAETRRTSLERRVLQRPLTRDC